MTFQKALAWSVYGQIISYVVFFGGSVLIARLLTPHEMGVFAIAMATIGVLNTLVAFDIGTYVVRATELHPSTMDSAFTVNGLLSCSISAAIYAFSVVEGAYLDSPDVAQVLSVLALSPLIGMFEFRPGTMLRREMNFRPISIINIAKTFVGTPLAVILAMNGYSFMSLAYSNIAGAVFGVICTNLVARRHVSLRLSLREGREMAIFGVHMMSIGGVAGIAARISEILLGNMLGLAALGLYSRASSIAGILFENVYGAITRVVFVKLSEDFRTKGTVRDIFLTSFEMILALMWPAQMGLAVLSGPAIYLLYGERWLAAAVPLSLLMIAQSVVLCFGMNWELFVIRHETARQVRFEAIRAVVGVMTFAFGCLFNITAAAVGRIAEGAFGFLLYQPHMSRMAETRPGEFLRIFMNSAGLTVAAVLPSLLLMIATGWSHRTSPSLIGGAILLGVVLWLAVLAVQRHPLLKEIRAVVHKVLPRKMRRAT